MTLQILKSGGQVADHGGSLGRARALFPRAPEPWLDLSTGINPHSYPLFDLPATALSRLPETSRLRTLLEVAAAAYGAAGADHVVAAPGTQILLPRVAALVGPSRAAVLGPTYAEHARAAALAGHTVAEVTNLDALAAANLAIVVNPNNPDGRMLDRAELIDLAAGLAAKGGLLVVDEAFMDVAQPDRSMAGLAGVAGLVVLRSFGKFFGLGGVRLGFALGRPDLVARLDAELGPWAVSGLALEYGISALADRDWQVAMRLRLAKDAARLDALFASVGMPVCGGTMLYRYLALADAADLFAGLGERGILMRNFSWSLTALRCGLPGTEPDWVRLEAALVELSAPDALARRGANA